MIKAGREWKTISQSEVVFNDGTQLCFSQEIEMFPLIGPRVEFPSVWKHLLLWKNIPD